MDKVRPGLIAGLLSCVILLGALGMVAWPARQQERVLPALPAIKAPRVQVPITLDAPLADMPAKLPVYRVIYAKADAAHVRGLSEVMGIQAELTATEDGWAAQQGARTVQVYGQTGAFWFQDRERLWQDMGASSLPTAETATAWASAFLQAQGLLPLGMIEDGIGYSELTVYDVASGAQTTTRTDMQVNYRLTVDGMPVAGPGGSIKVYLGEGHRLIGLYWAGFELKREIVVPVIAAREALAQLEAEGIAATIKGATSAVVQDVDLVYYAGPGDQPQTHLTPVYRVRGIVRGSDEAQPFTQYLPAVADAAWQGSAWQAAPSDVELPTAQAKPRS